MSRLIASPSPDGHKGPPGDNRSPVAEGKRQVEASGQGGA